MTERLCITHELQTLHPADRPRPCMRHDKHYAACDNPRCRGCVPRSARHGYLCDACWLKAEDAVARAGDLILHLRSVESAATPIGERVDTTRRAKVPIPDTWQAADDLLAALGSAPFPSQMSIDSAFDYVDQALAPWMGENLEEQANTIAGASGLVQLIHRMQTALARWPSSEVTKRSIPYLLCPTCGQQTLERRAPLAYLDAITVGCGNNACDYTRDWFDWLDFYAPIIAGIFDAQEPSAKPRPRRAPKRAPRASRPCADGQHESCRALECRCDCHERTYSLYSVKVPYHLLKGRR